MPWDYTQQEYDKQAAADPKWDLERRICYGLEGKKLNRAMLEKYLPELNIPENKRKFLELLIWNKGF